MTTHRLIAWIGDQPVGTLSYHDDTGRFSFEYTTAWVSDSRDFPISPALPFQRPAVQTDELHSVNVRRFFENLLPEGKALEDAAAAHVVSKGNLFGLLRWLGQESTGALALLPEGTTPIQVSELRRALRAHQGPVQPPLQCMGRPGAHVHRRVSRQAGCLC